MKEHKPTLRQNKNISVSIIGTQGIPAQYGGFETLAQQLVENLNDKVNFTVYCSSSAYKEHPKLYKNAQLKYIPLKANGLQSIFYDIISILCSLRKNKYLLVLGVSGALIFPFIKVFSSKRLIIHIDGLEWKRAKWGHFTRQMLKMFERISIRFGDVIISDNKAIQDYVTSEYGKKSILIEYGGNQAGTGINFTNMNDYAFTVCRIEPENNIHILLKAYSLMPNKSLKVVGNWNVGEYGKSLRNEYKKYSNIEMLDPIYDVAKLNSLRKSCKVYLHGHSAGGTNPSLVEAMFIGLPIIAFDVSYNRNTTENKAYYFSDYKELIQQLQGISNTDYQECSDAMKCIAEKRYRWDIIVNKYYGLFN